MPDGHFGSLPIPYNVTENPNSLAEEIAQLDSEKASKSTTINGKSLEADRVIYAQDVPSKNVLPGIASTQTISGVTFTVNADGTISTSGTATAEVQFYRTLLADETISYNGMILSGCPDGGGTDTFWLGIQRASTPWTWYARDYGDGATIASESANANLMILVRSGQNMNGKVFRPMIRLASIEDAEYVPYSKTAVELTKEAIDYHTVIKKSYANTNVKASALKARRQGNVVYIASPQDSKAMAAGTTTFVTLDAEFRPTAENVTVPLANVFDGSFVTILTTGAIVIYHPTAVSSAANNCAFSAVYIVD